MRRLLILAAAVGTAAVISVACGSVNNSGGPGPTPPLVLSTGNYTITSYSAGSDGCNLNGFDPTGLSMDGYAAAGQFVSAIDLQFPGGITPNTFLTVSSSHTLTVADQVSTLHYQPVHYAGGGGILCTVQQTFKARGTITSADVADLTIETDLAQVSGSQCAALLGLKGYSLPCSSVETFELHKTGAPTMPTAPTPTPNPVAVSATLSASSDVTNLVDYLNTTNGQGALAGFSLTVSGSTVTNPGHSWWCYGPDYTSVFNYGALVEGSAASFYLTVSTASWSVGSKTIDPNNVYVEIITLDSNQNPVLDLVGQSGSVTLNSAGRLVDVPTSFCKYSLSGVSVSGYKLAVPPPGPRLARDLKSLARRKDLRMFATPAE